MACMQSVASNHVRIIVTTPSCVVTLPGAQSASKQHARTITSLILLCCQHAEESTIHAFLKVIGLANAYPSAVLLHGYVRCQSYSSTLIPALAHSTAYIGLSSTNTLAPSSLQHQLLDLQITPICYTLNIMGQVSDRD